MLDPSHAQGGPADQWDALPAAGKAQIICVVGFLEMWSETSTVLEMDGEKHYVRGGKPVRYTLSHERERLHPSQLVTHHERERERLLHPRPSPPAL